MGFWVGDWLVEPTLSRIRRGDSRVHIEPRSIEVLECLAMHPGEVLSKEHLIRSVWEESFVSDEVLTHAIWELRKAFEDDARNPTYIQTIPKKGYRLVVPVRAVASARPEATSRQWSRSPWSWLGGLAILALIGWAIMELPDTPTAPGEPVGAKGARLVLAAAPDQGPGADLLPAVYRALSHELIGIRGLSLVDPSMPAEAWGRPPDLFDYLLELELLTGSGSAVAGSLRGLVSGEAVYGWQVSLIAEPSPRQIAKELAPGVVAFARFNELPQAYDPDLAPWFSPKKHELEAIRAFLEGVAYTLRFESGSTGPYTRAIQIDPDFPAPLIWLTSSLLGKPEELAAHRKLLAKLKTDSAFERAVIDMALSLVDLNWPRVQTHLEVALQYEPENGPALVVLAMAQSFNGNLNGALESLNPLLERPWRYPSIYPQAAEYAIRLDRPERAREILSIGVNVGAAEGAEPIVLDTWVLLEALALFDRDAPSVHRYRLGLEERRGELPPDQVRIQTPLAIEHLIRRAADAGQPAAADAISRLLAEFTEKTD